jgi:superfamily II DNA or RNA helicase
VSEFRWENLSDDAVRRFAQVVWSRDSIQSKKAAVELLNRDPGVPTADFFRNPGVRSAACYAWLPDDAEALDRVYSRLLNRGIKPPASGRAASRRTKLARVRDRIFPYGPPVTAPVREALHAALLASGGATVGGHETQKLERFMEIATVGDPVRLHEYQERVTASLRRVYRARGSRMVGVVVMPTGAGKTVTAVHWLLDGQVRRNRRVLWITHRKELLEQTARSFIRCAPVLGDQRPSFAMRLIGGGYSQVSTIADSHNNVIIATIGALSYDPKPVEAFLRATNCTVVFDEAHHCVAPTWRRVLKYAREKSDDVVLGLTATPTRMSDAERATLGRLLESTIEQVTMGELVATGYLAEARCESEPTHVDVERSLARPADLAHIRKFGELSERLAKALAENVPRNRVIVERYRKGPRDRKQRTYGKTLIFATTIEHAHTLAGAFARAGTAAGALTSWRSTLYTPGTRVKKTNLDRTDLLDQFRDGKLKVLVNVAVLTEGVDVPNVETVFLARPTGSEILMSQMVGRALRGEKVGGTKHAYLVSFRDHWDQFDHWMDPIKLPGIAGVDSEPEPRVSRPGHKITINETDWRALLEAAAAEAEEHIPVGVGDGWSRVPVGLYAFEVEVPVDNGSGVREIDTRLVHLWIYAHDRAGFEALEEAVRAGSAGTKADRWLKRYFGGTPNPRPTLARLELLASYVRAEGGMPDFIPLERRPDVDPYAVARSLTKITDVRKRLATLNKTIEGNRTLVDAAFGGEQEYRRLVAEILVRLDLGVSEDFSEIRVPRIGPGPKTDYVYGGHAHDLNGILDRVMVDRTLFKRRLPRLSGGIAWMERPRGSAWAYYDWQRRKSGTLTNQIRINPWLDSTVVPEYVIEFLVYHELLHHQDVAVLGDEASHHDQDFRERERTHPRTIEANAFIDTLLDHRNPKPKTPARH